MEHFDYPRWELDFVDWVGLSLRVLRRTFWRSCLAVLAFMSVPFAVMMIGLLLVGASFRTVNSVEQRHAYVEETQVYPIVHDNCIEVSKNEFLPLSDSDKVAGYSEAVARAEDTRSEETSLTDRSTRSMDGSRSADPANRFEAAKKLMAGIPAFPMFAFGLGALGLALGYFACKSFMIDLTISQFQVFRVPLEKLFSHTFRRTMWFALALETILIVLPNIVQGPIVGVISIVSHALSVLALFVLMIVNLYINGRLDMALPAIVGEGLNPIEALQRSWTMSKDNRSLSFWRAIGITFVNVVFAVAVAGLLTLLVEASTLWPTNAKLGFFFLSALWLWMFASLVFSPVLRVVSYFDFRHRTEGENWFAPPVPVEVAEPVLPLTSENHSGPHISPDTGNDATGEDQEVTDESPDDPLPIS